jgi:hypothetical protein
VLDFSFILNAFLRRGFGLMRDPRNYNWGGLNQAIPDFFFAARCDGAIRALMLNSA